MKPYGMNRGQWIEVDRTDGKIGCWLIKEPSKKAARRASLRVLWDEMLEAERRHAEWVEHLRQIELELSAAYVDTP